jgi:hypothetical protein
MKRLNDVKLKLSGIIRVKTWKLSNDLANLAVAFLRVNMFPLRMASVG